LVKHLYIGVLSFAGKSFNKENRGSDKVCPVLGRRNILALRLYP
jgi:hypothetical protein